MNLTYYTDYALRLLIYLQAFDDEPVSVRQVSEAYGISSNHLAKVAQQLTQLGWVTSQRGRGGGLVLAPHAPDLKLGDVVRELEPHCNLVECHGAASTCPLTPACRLKGILLEAREAFFATLNRYTLADLARRPQRLAGLLHTSPGKI